MLLVPLLDGFPAEPWQSRLGVQALPLPLGLVEEWMGWWELGEAVLAEEEVVSVDTPAGRQDGDCRYAGFAARISS